MFLGQHMSGKFWESAFPQQPLPTLLRFCLLKEEWGILQYWKNLRVIHEPWQELSRESVSTCACAFLREKGKTLKYVHLFCPNFPWSRLKQFLNKKTPLYLGVFLGWQPLQTKSQPIGNPTGCRGWEWSSVGALDLHTQGSELVPSKKEKFLSIKF